MKRGCIILLTAALMLMVLFQSGRIAGAASATIAADERIVFFPTAASLDPHRRIWNVPIHGWIFEPEADSLWRKAVLATLSAALDLDDVPADNAIFKQRAALFLVDNQRGKIPDIRMDGHIYSAGRSAANGHFHNRIQLPAEAAIPTVAGWKRYSTVCEPACSAVFAGAVQMVPPEGISVISDIDDTIKVSQVTDKSALMANTFLHPFAPVPHMADRYRQWAQKGAVFHYVSASPWQLYPPLQRFIKDQGFPAGSVDLRLFRVKDRSAWHLIEGSQAFKTSRINTILARFPRRRFLLVGDSGEQDPEIYGAIFRRHPGRILHIYIRRLSTQPPGSWRFAAAFAGVPPARWTLFDDPRSLGDLVAK